MRGVLLVENVPTDRDLLQCFFNFRVEVATDYEKAHSVLRDRIPDVICVNVSVLDKAGLAFCGLVRHDERLDGVPIVVLTDRIPATERVKAEAMGADMILERPFKSGALFGCLDVLLDEPIGKISAACASRPTPAQKRLANDAARMANELRSSAMTIRGGILTHSCRPSPPIYDALRSENLDCWWNLAEELDDLLPEMRRVAREVLWAQIPDFQPPVDAALFDEQLVSVCAILQGGGRVHVSCFGGIGRTGLAVACVRVRMLGESSQDALAAAFEACGGPLTVEQKDFVHALAAR
jgi:CheY-like chemotaxis protein